jgi:hypothetical protein
LIDFTINIYIIKTDNTNTFHCPFEEVWIAKLITNQKQNHKQH